MAVKTDAQSNLAVAGAAGVKERKGGGAALLALRPLIILVVFGAIFVGINEGACIYIARKYQYAAQLGITRNGLYPPFLWIRWQLLYGRADQITFYSVNWCVVIGTILDVFISLGLGLIIGRKKAAGLDGLHGTAKFCDSVEEIKEYGLLAEAGNAGGSVMIGGWQDKKAPGQPIYYLQHSGPEHVMVMAPTRSGKGVGLIVPTLLTWTNSAVIHDIKGELWAMTSGWREKYANNYVLKFDPADVSDAGCSYNVLAEIRLDTEYAISDAQNIATILVDPQGEGIEDDHWAGSAHSLFTGLMLFSLLEAKMYNKPLPGLGDISVTISDPKRDDRKLWQDMIDLTQTIEGVEEETNAKGEPLTDEEKEKRKKTILELQERLKPLVDAGEISTTIFNVIALVGVSQQRLQNGGDGGEYTSVMSTARRYIAIYADPVLRRHTTRSDFLVNDLVNSDKPVSLYLVVRPSDKDRLRPVMRLMLTQIMRGLTRKPLQFDPKDNRPLKQHKHRLLMLMDEFPAFNKLDVFAENMAFVAGYGIKCYVIIQDVLQLRKQYTENEQVTANCHVRVAYAPNTDETAETLSKMTGTTTVVVENISESRDKSGQVTGTTRSFDNVSRPLMTSDEVSRMKAPQKVKVSGEERIVGRGDMLIFVAGQNPIYGTQPLYFMDDTYVKRSSVTRAETSSKLPHRNQESKQATASEQAREAFKINNDTEEEVTVA